MATFNYHSDRADLLLDLLEDFRDATEVSEHCILELENNPQDGTLLRSLFRSVHTTKGNLSIVGMLPMVDVVQALEDVLDLVRQGNIPFSNLVGDLTLLLLDQVKVFIEDCHHHQSAEWDRPLIEQVTRLIKQLPTSTSEEHHGLLTRILSLLDPGVMIEEIRPEEESDDWMVVLQDDDLSFLFEQAKLAEHRARFWNGRTDRLVKLMLEYNEEVQSGIPDEELVAAILAHDIAMAYTPLSILNKEGKLDQEETDRVRHHIEVAHSLLDHLHRFNTAQEILLQHHEFANGLGYPGGLNSETIHPGAKMLAIVHAFESISHGQTAFTQTRRPMARAILELSRNTGTQFSETMMEPFQSVLRKKGWLSR